MRGRRAGDEFGSDKISPPNPTEANSWGHRHAPSSSMVASFQRLAVQRSWQKIGQTVVAIEY